MKIRKGIDEDSTCQLCKGGRVWEKERFYYEDEFSSDEESRICGGCNTKYYFEKDVNELKPGLQQVFIRLLWKKIMGGKTMETQKLLKMRELHEQSGICIHEFVPSNTVRTPEGQFVFHICPICKVGRVTREGKTYEDEIFKLVNWVAHKGIEHTKMKDIMEKFSQEQMRFV